METWREDSMKITKVALLLAAFVAAATIFANAQTQVSVPGNASGYFGNPADQNNPLVAAITVSEPGTITVTYVSGLVSDGVHKNIGPNGVRCKGKKCGQLPLEEAKGVFNGGKWQRVYQALALIGVFVSSDRVNLSGFTAADGTKGVEPVGIMPGGLFFIGTGKTFTVTEAGTLYLGINDNWVSDNYGGFNVTVSAQ
jgi:hypothetical protein